MDARLLWWQCGAAEFWCAPTSVDMSGLGLDASVSWPGAQVQVGSGPKCELAWGPSASWLKAHVQVG